jgi:hypothetical protein
MASDPVRQKTQFEEDGFVIIPGLISPEDFPRLEQASADVISRTREGSWPHRRTVGKQFPPYDGKYVNLACATLALRILPVMLKVGHQPRTPIRGGSSTLCTQILASLRSPNGTPRQH